MRDTTAIVSLILILVSQTATVEARPPMHAPLATTLQSTHGVIAADRHSHHVAQGRHRRRDIAIATLPWFEDFGGGEWIADEVPTAANPPPHLALAAAPRPAAAVPLPPCRESEGGVEIIRGGACAR